MGKSGVSEGKSECTGAASSEVAEVNWRTLAAAEEAVAGAAVAVAAVIHAATVGAAVVEAAVVEAVIGALEVLTVYNVTFPPPPPPPA